MPKATRPRRTTSRGCCSRTSTSSRAASSTSRRSRRSQIMKKRYPELVKNLTSNPLGDSLEVTPNRAENVDKLYDSIVLPHKPPGVDRVLDGKQVSHRILQVAQGEASENYSIAIPPPNVTGALHMGHALNGSIQDVLDPLRTACAGSARSGSSAPTTPASRRRRRSRSGCSRRARAARSSAARRSSQRVWEWREQYGGTIVEQFKRLGASCDYEDERFTIDEAYVARGPEGLRRPLREGPDLPRQLHGQLGPGQRSAISDLEVEEREVADTLYYDRLPARGRRRRDRRRHGAPGDDARRHRGRGAPERRALPRTSIGSDGDPAARRPARCRSSPTSTSSPSSAPAR